MAPLDQLGELLVEEGQQQALDVQAVHVGVGEEDDPPELEPGVVEGGAGAAAEHGQDGADLLVLHDPLQVGLGHVEGLAAQLEHGLELGEAPLGGGAPGGVPLHDEQLGPLRGRW